MENNILAIGIDLGTTNSAVGIWWNNRVEIIANSGGSRVTPSYGYYDVNNELVGNIAKSKLTIAPENVFFDAKRLLAEKTSSGKLRSLQEFWPFQIDEHEGKVQYVTNTGWISPERISANVLKALLADVRRRTGVKDDTEIEAVITVPAYFNMAQKRATMEAACLAGVKVIQLLSEPVAGAISYQYETESDKFKDGETVFIFDLGGGTFDVTIMKIENKVYKVIALGGDSRLGGRDFDNIIARMIEDALRDDIGNTKLENLKKNSRYRYKLLDLAVKTKEALTTTDSEEIALSDITNEAKKIFEITSENFENNSKELIGKIKEHCLSTLKDAKLKPENIKHITLVGGASKMKFVKRIISEIFGEGRTGTTTVNGDEAIALGATLFAAKLLDVTSDPKIQSIKVRDALPLSIGIEVVGNKFKPILEHNSPIPSRNTITLRTSENFQKTAKIPIYEGLSEEISKDTYIAQIEISGIPEKKAKLVQIEVTLELDINGILKAETKVVGTDIIINTDIKYESTFEHK